MNVAGVAADHALDFAGADSPHEFFQARAVGRRARDLVLVKLHLGPPHRRQ